MLLFYLLGAFLSLIAHIYIFKSDIKLVIEEFNCEPLFESYQILLVIFLMIAFGAAISWVSLLSLLIIKICKNYGR